MANLVINDLAIFRGKKVMVIGNTGFKGSWLALWLHELGAEVLGFALPPERTIDHFNLIELNKLIHQVYGDIRDLGTLLKIAEEFKPEFFFHLAAQPLVRRSYEEPKLTFDTNVGGSVNILEVVRCCPFIRVLLYVTSDKCYLNQEWVWGYRENDQLGGPDPYSASKASAELVFTAYAKSFFEKRQNLGTASVRAGNVIGGGDWSPDRIVPDCIQRLQKEEPIVLRNPDSTRPWQHVLEPLGGYLILASHLYHEPKKYSGPWNFGPSDDTVRSVNDLAKRIITYWGHGDIQIHRENQSFYEADFLQLNCDKALHKLGWQAKWNFEKTVEETVRWYRTVSEGQKACQISKKQIYHYMERNND